MNVKSVYYTISAFLLFSISFAFIPPGGKQMDTYHPDEKLLLWTEDVVISQLSQQQLNLNEASGEAALEEVLIVKIEIKSEIGPGSWRNLQRAFDLADSIGAKAMVIDLNTFGGALLEADSMRTKILNANFPVYVLINPNAASAGALISIACDKIYMVESATIGAATVVNQTGEALPDKYQSYMRGIIRSTAEQKGRDPKIAEAMVDERIEIEGVTKAGQVITFTTSEAIENGFCDGKAQTIEQLLKQEGYENYKLRSPETTWVDEIILLLINPAVSSILLLIMIGGIYFEVQTPGVGFPILASAIAAMLYFAPLYLEGIANHWDILIFVIGVALLMVEFFVLPGFGISGILGLILIFLGLSMSLISPELFEFSFKMNDFSYLVRPVLTVFIAMVLSITGMLFVGGKLMDSPAFNRLVMGDTLKKGGTSRSTVPSVSTETTADSSDQPEDLTGQEGESMTDLYPSGKVRIADEVYDAISEGQYIEKGEKVKVMKDRKNVIVVRKIT